MKFNNIEPIYLQIKEYYKKLIVSGAIKYGEILPSIREVALLNGINPNTVVRAYNELLTEGIIESIPKKGYFVKYQADSSFAYKGLKERLLTFIKENDCSIADVEKIIEEIKEEENDKG